MPYQHNNKDPNLNNIHHALQLRNDGTPELRVNASGVSISGGVSIDDIVVSNAADNPIPVSRNKSPNNSSNPIFVNVTNASIPITDNGGSITVDGSVSATVSGNVSISNFPATQPISGSVSISGTPTISVSNFPATQPISGSVTATVSGTVDIGNFPATQPISGTVDIGNFPATQTVSGTVNIGTIPEVEIKNDSGNPISVSDGGGSITVDGSVTATISGTPTVNIGTIPEVEIKNDIGNPLFIESTGSGFFAPTQTDAFGRLRISSPFTLFDSFHRFVDNGKFNTAVTGGGTATHNLNTSSILMSVGTASGDSVIRETRRVFAYQPGKSLLIMTTSTFAAGKTNLRQRNGFFDEQNGIFLEQESTSVYIVKRSFVTGVTVDTRVIQSSWNVNTLASLDLSKSQIFWIDLEWLGVGSIRCGFIINGEYVHCHTFHHANIITSTYMTTAILPGRLEITNTGTTASASTMEQICFTVISEGGYELQGTPASAGTDLATPIAITAGTVIPMFSMRLKSARLNGLILPKSYSLAVTGNNNYKYSIVLGGTTAGGAWVTNNAASCVEYNLTATSITGGTTIEIGYIVATNQGTQTPTNVETTFKNQLERNTFTSTAFEYTVCLEMTGNAQSAWTSVQWDEIT